MRKSHIVDGALEAWLPFLTRDDLGSVLELVNRHPEFADLYRDIAEFRKDPKELIGMFSEALKIMDHNTELFMIDEMKEEINALKEQINVIKQEHQQELRLKDEENQTLREKTVF